MANKGSIASIIIISILVLGMGGYIAFDQEWILSGSDEPTAGIKGIWYAEGKNFDFDGAVMMDDTLFNITVNEGEIVYLDFRAIINGYDEVFWGSLQFYVWYDGVQYAQPQFLYTIEPKTGHQLISASFQYSNSTMTPGNHTVQIRATESTMENPSLRTWSFLVQTIVLS